VEASDFDHGQIVQGAAVVVTGRDVPELLELVETSFYQVALLVFRLAVSDAIVAVRFGGMCGMQSWSSIKSPIQSASHPLSATTSAPAASH
jgi:hypothetical protein